MIRLMLKKSPFYDFLDRRPDSGAEDENHIDWNGYLLPNDYGDAEHEYQSIRGSCAMFDVSPMRKIRIHGKGAGAFLDRLLTRPASGLANMRAAYTVFCNDDGSLKDDAIVYKFADDDYLMMPSDIDHCPYFETVCARFNLADVTFAECTEAWAGVAIQGPSSAAVLQHIVVDAVEQLRPFEAREYELGGGAIGVARMGFTADLGYECWLAPSLLHAFKDSIEAARSALGIELPGYGLSALQACRLEGGFIVAGWDCSTEIEPRAGFERSPYELGLGWLVDLNGEDFIGKEALVEQHKNGSRYALRYLSIDDDRQLPDGTEIFAIDSDDVIGSVNCSSWSWGLQKMIGNASIKSGFGDSKRGRISLDGDFVELELSSEPLLDLPRRNQVPAPVN